MSTARVSGQVLPFRGGGLTREAEVAPLPWRSKAFACAGSARAAERQQALDAVHDAMGAAMTADTALCRLRVQQALSLCTGRPHAAWAARQAVVRTLAVDIVARHLRACDKRRRLQREIEDLATRLHLMAAPDAA